MLIYNGPLGDFEQVATTGAGWGDDRSARALAVSSDYLCQVFPPESTVVDADAAAATVDDRITLAVRNTVNQFIGRLSCETQTSLIERAEALLGKWDEDTSNQAGRRILAGLAAIQLGLPEGQTLLDAQFLGMVDAYILNRVTQFKEVGTNADFDFQEMVLAGILYRFRTATLAGGQFLLSDQAVQKLLNIDCDPTCPDRTVPHNLLYEVSSLVPAAPESENHILMINTWHYLVGQWVAAASPRQGALPQAPANALETKVLDLLARVVTNIVLGLERFLGRKVDAQPAVPLPGAPRRASVWRAGPRGPALYRHRWRRNGPCGPTPSRLFADCEFSFDRRPRGRRRLLIDRSPPRLFER